MLREIVPSADTFDRFQDNVLIDPSHRSTASLCIAYKERNLVAIVLIQVLMIFR
jgi:hypothetical protein